MKAVAHPSARKPRVLLALQLWHVALRLNGGQIKHGVGVVVLANHVCRVNLAHGVERHDHILAKWQRLQQVEPVVQAYAGGFGAVVCGAFVVPSGPCELFFWHHRGVGVQHGAVGVVANRAQGILLLRCWFGQHG